MERNESTFGATFVVIVLSGPITDRLRTRACHAQMAKQVDFWAACSEAFFESSLATVMSQSKKNEETFLQRKFDGLADFTTPATREVSESTKASLKSNEHNSDNYYADLEKRRSVWETMANDPESSVEERRDAREQLKKMDDAAEQHSKADREFVDKVHERDLIWKGAAFVGVVGLVSAGVASPAVRTKLITIAAPNIWRALM